MMDYIDRIRARVAGWLRLVAGWLDPVKQERVVLSPSPASFKDAFYRKLPVDMVRDCVQRKGRDGWTTTTTHVLACLVSRIDIRQNRAELSRRELARLTKLDGKTAAFHARLLAAAGWIAIEGRPDRPGRNKPNVYRLAGDYAGVILYGEPIPAEGDAIPPEEAERGTDSPSYEIKGRGLGESLLNRLQKTLMDLHKNNTESGGESSGDGDFVPAELSDPSSFSSLKEGKEPPGEVNVPNNPRLTRGLGLGLEKTQELIQTYGVPEFNTVVSMAQARDDLKNPAGWIISVLQRRSKEKRGKAEDGDPRRYVTGEYADYVQH